MAEAIDTRSSWLIPAFIAAAAALGSALLTVAFQHVDEAVVDRREVARIRYDIIKSAADSKSLVVSAMLLEHVLKPIDRAPDIAEFERKIREYIATLATETSPGSPARIELSSAAPVAPGGITDLIAKFQGAERLAASNGLVELARTSKAAVVAALVSAIVPPADRLGYRINLYIVFTLSRLPGGWQGSPEQLSRVRQLANSALYRDAIFKARLDEALAEASAIPP